MIVFCQRCKKYLITFFETNVKNIYLFRMRRNKYISSNSQKEELQSIYLFSAHYGCEQLWTFKLHNTCQKLLFVAEAGLLNILGYYFCLWKQISKPHPRHRTFSCSQDYKYFISKGLCKVFLNCTKLTESCSDEIIITQYRKNNKSKPQFYS